MTAGRVVVRRQRMPVGDEKQAGYSLLQPDPVLEHTVVMPQMQAPGGAHAGDHAVLVHVLGFLELKKGLRSRWIDALTMRIEDNAKNVGEQQDQQDRETIRLQTGKLYARRLGNRLTTMRPPSSGSMGSRLSSINTRLTVIPASAIRLSGTENVFVPGAISVNFNASAHSSAINRLESGTGRRHPQHVALGVAQRRESTGTGLAQPNKIAPPNVVSARSAAAPAWCPPDRYGAAD